jgi:hypothetical protein
MRGSQTSDPFYDYECVLFLIGKPDEIIIIIIIIIIAAAK